MFTTCYIYFYKNWYSSISLQVLFLDLHSAFGVWSLIGTQMVYLIR